MKKIRSMPFSRTSIQKSHQEAALGNRSVKHLRGWSRRNFSSSHTPLPVGTIFVIVQIVNRSMHGNPVFPMTIRNDPMNSGRTAVSNDIIESGVSVNPKSLNIDAGVKIPLGQTMSKVGDQENTGTYHHTRFCPSPSTTGPQVLLRTIHGRNVTTPNRCHTT